MTAYDKHGTPIQFDERNWRKLPDEISTSLDGPEWSIREESTGFVLVYQDNAEANPVYYKLPKWVTELVEKQRLEAQQEILRNTHMQKLGLVPPRQYEWMTTLYKTEESALHEGFLRHLNYWQPEGWELVSHTWKPAAIHCIWRRPKVVGF